MTDSLVLDIRFELRFVAVATSRQGKRRGLSPCFHDYVTFIGAFHACLVNKTSKCAAAGGVSGAPQPARDGARLSCSMWSMASHNSRQRSLHTSLSQHVHVHVMFKFNSSRFKLPPHLMTVI